jgi:hypothetical protein
VIDLTLAIIGQAETRYEKPAANPKLSSLFIVTPTGFA